MPFSTLELSEPILRVLNEVGYLKPTPIQQKAIPAVLSGRDVLAIAQTGTGKTASFVLPLLQRLACGPKAKANHVRVLVLTPTRELALQVDEAVAGYGKYLPLKTCTVYGGVKINHWVIEVDKSRKSALLSHLVRNNDWPQALVFIRTKQGADNLVKRLAKDGIEAAAFHGDKSQAERSRTLAAFKAHQVRILVATDLAARGLDIPVFFLFLKLQLLFFAVT